MALGDSTKGTLQSKPTIKLQEMKVNTTFAYWMDSFINEALLIVL